MAIEAPPTFQNYTELPRLVPIKVWHGIRATSVLAMFALCAVLFVKPASGLYIFWKVVIRLLPLLFFLAPGVWRNLCPLAASNQTPRLFGFSRAWTAPPWLRDNAYIISIVLFFGIAATRKVVFNTNGPALAIALLLTMVNAFLGGVFLKGKSGWCSSICPLLPVQRLYGQTPFIVSPNSHCQPCVGCTKNCYDFNPKPAYQADLHDDIDWSARRRFFAGAFPGFVLGFLSTAPPHLSNFEIYMRLALFTGASVGSFFALDALLRISASKLTALYASAAINIFYWFNAVTITASFKYYTGTSVHFLIWPIRALVLALTLIWIARTFRVERLYEAETAPASTAVKLGVKATEALKGETKAGGDTPEVQFVPDDHAAVAEIGASLLDVAEKDGKTIEAGCRMGICGADPIAVLEGMECLAAAENDELTTLRRLGLASTTRMACCATVQTAGRIKVSLTPERGDASAAAKAVGFDRSITSVVVLGNGIAGVTVADYIRRGHPDCEIHVVGREAHVLYNRMGISRLIYGRSAMQGLYLLPEDWYDEHGVTAWLNTAAAKIDVQKRTVLLRTGDTLPWDKLILATGSSSMVPPSVEGFGRPGTFVVREAADAMELRAYAQQHQAQRAVVAGAGLLGLEAAHAIYELGLKVTVFERGKRLMAKQIDARTSELVYNYFRGLGIEVLYGAETKSLPGEGPVQEVLLTDGRKLPCDIFVVAVGIRPNAELAKEAGIEVNRGVVVNDLMQTNIPGVFAAGDVAEHRGMVTGLWPTAVKQAEVAATNALGGSDSVDFEPPICILKGVGLELTSAGRFEEAEGDTTIILEDPSQPSYRKLVLSDNKVVGMIILGHHPEDVTAATYAVKRGVEVHHSWMYALRQGDWKILKSDMSAAKVEVLDLPTAHPFRPDPTTPRTCRDCGRTMAEHVAARRV
ncbi:MAG: FAD-dependent oxidoreductase [Acidimicrobiales bacterium]